MDVKRLDVRSVKESGYANITGRKVVVKNVELIHANMAREKTIAVNVTVGHTVSTID